MRDRRVRRQRSKRPSWQASPVLVVRLGSIRNPLHPQAQNSDVLQHLAKLLGCRCYEGDEVRLAKPALGAMALQVSARAAMKHRRMRGGDARLARLETKRDDAAPVAVIRVVRITRKLHRLRFKFGKQFAEVARLLREIAIDVAERRCHFVHHRDAILDQAESHPGLQQDKAGADFLDEWASQFREDEFVWYEQVAELHAI